MGDVFATMHWQNSSELKISAIAAATANFRHATVASRGCPMRKAIRRLSPIAGAARTKISRGSATYMCHVCAIILLPKILMAAYYEGGPHEVRGSTRVRVWHPRARDRFNSP